MEEEEDMEKDKENEEEETVIGEEKGKREKEE